MSTRFLARIDAQGRICPVVAERTLRRAGKEVWVSLHEQPSIGLRTDQSNRYLWGGIYGEIARQTGNDPEDIHYGLKRKAVELGVLDPEYVLLGDQLIEADPTTRTDQDTFSRYTNWIRSEAEHGRLTGISFHIPEADEWKAGER